MFANNRHLSQGAGKVLRPHSTQNVMSHFRPRHRTLPLLVSFAFAAGATCATAKPTTSLSWDMLPPIPDANGFASPFAGVNYGALIVAGGTNFPEKRVWEGGTKVWYDNVYALETPEGKWKQVGKLPRPIGGGVAVSTRNGIACIGGGDAKQCYADCYLLKYKNGRVVTSPLPSLPKPCANGAGILVGDTIYVAGGIERPDVTSTLNSLWSLDLRNTATGWQTRKPWPGPGRMLATMAAEGESIYLFSGADLKSGADGKPERIWLKDAYRFSPGGDWERIADLPRVAVAAPSPALPLAPSQLLILGGDDGAQAASPPQSHTGFPRDVLVYDTKKNKWKVAGNLPFGLVATPAVRWKDRIVIPGGEEHPSVRSNNVWSATLSQ